MAETCYFTADAVEELRACLQGVLELSREAFERLPDGLSISPVDPTGVVECLQSLRLGSEYVLGGYQSRAGSNGYGCVVAVLAGEELPPPEDCSWRPVEVAPGLVLDEPLPPRALDHFMDAFRGDGSARAYLEASIVCRELMEFGAVWHGCDWVTHAVLDADPFVAGALADTLAPGDGPASDESEWTWRRRPEEWRPSVTLHEGGGAEVRFISHSGLGREILYAHRDTFAPGCLRPESERAIIATGPAGYVF